MQNLSTVIKLPFVRLIKIFVMSIFEWPLKTGFTVVNLSLLFDIGGDADIKEKTTLDDKQTDSPGKAAVTMETASGGSPAKPTLEPAEPSEEAFNDIDGR